MSSKIDWSAPMYLYQFEDGRLAWSSIGPTETDFYLMGAGVLLCVFELGDRKMVNEINQDGKKMEIPESVFRKNPDGDYHDYPHNP